MAADSDDLSQLKSSDNITDLQTLLQLLCGPLQSVGLLPPQFRKYTNSSNAKTRNIIKQYPTIQRTLLEKILPAWDHIIAEHGLSAIIDQYFCPDAFSFASDVAGQVVLMSYSTILSTPFNEFSIRFLSRLAKEYPVDRLHQAVTKEGAIKWEDYVRNVIVVPAKVANFLGGKGDIPDDLENGSYFNHLCLRTEQLIASTSAGVVSNDSLQDIAYLLTKLVNIGAFPAQLPVTRSQPSFFHASLPTIRERAESSEDYRHIWTSLFSTLSTPVIKSMLISLLSCLDRPPPLDASPPTRGRVNREATLLRRVVGNLTAEKRELWLSVSAAVILRERDVAVARILVCWVGMSDSSLESLLSDVLDVWTSAEHIKHSLLKRHQYTTSLVLLTISYLPSSSSAISTLALSPSFINSIGLYLKHLDPDVRRCGMFVAEQVAGRAGKKLDFGGWDGEDAGKLWIKAMRSLIVARDIDFPPVETASDNTGISAPAPPSAGPPAVVELAEADSDDESIEGYASDGVSDHSTSPTPSELDEIEKDPTLNVGTKKVPRPVYLAQLGELVRSTNAGLKSGENLEPQKIEMALSCGEELVRRKKSFGTELEENSINLVYAFVGLQDSYDLDDFDQKRQAIVTALVACCPKKSAPAIIEQFFNNQYSTNQRFVMLTALALGARELASLPVPPSTVPRERTEFPSKRLPSALHQKLLPENPVQRLLVDISQKAIDGSKESAAERVPQLVRERHLRLQKTPRVVPAGTPVAMLGSTPSFTEIAAEYFVCPLINRFWAFLRDEQTREARSSYNRDPLYRYHGAGTGLVLSPVVLCQFLSTLGVLVHTARNAVQWLSVIAPDALELAVTVGTRPVSKVEDEGDGEDDDDGGGRGKEALVLCSALELAVVVVDGSLELDGGKSLGLEHTNLVLGAGEWAGKLLAQLEKGVLVSGGGGAQEIRLRRAAAGVVIKVDELTSKWRRSMIDVF